VAQKIVTVRYGSRVVKIKVSNDSDFIQNRILTTKAFYEEPLLVDAVSRLLPGDLCIDVGANIGNHTLFFSAVCEASVIAIEPHKENSDLLIDNVKLNQLDHLVSVHRIAAGQSSGRGNLTVTDPGNTGKARFTTDPGGLLEVVRLDDLLDGERAVKLMKVDVEGMELEVLKGAAGILQRDRPHLYVEASLPKEFLAVQGYLANFGYLETGRFNATATYSFESPPSDGASIRSLMRSVALMRAEVRELSNRVREFEAKALKPEG